jgi:DNA-binding transcriptional regulator YdaS (Cro superfamily)
MTAPAEAALERAKDAVGGAAVLARRLTVIGRPITTQGVSAWRRVPAERVVDVERATGVSRQELRPDLYQ